MKYLFILILIIGAGCSGNSGNGTKEDVRSDNNVVDTTKSRQINPADDKNTGQQTDPGSSTQEQPAVQPANTTPGEANQTGGKTLKLKSRTEVKVVPVDKNHISDSAAEGK